MTTPMIALVSVLLAVALLLIALSFDGPRRRLRSVMSTSPMRVFLGFVLIGAALAAGVALHNYKQKNLVSYGCGNCEITSSGEEKCSSTCHLPGRPSWADPAAIVVAFTGLGAGVSLITWGLRQPRS